MTAHPHTKILTSIRDCSDCSSTAIPAGSRARLCPPCALARRRLSRKAAKRRWTESNPGKSREVNDRANFKFKYGVTREQADGVLREQGGICAMRGCANPAIRVDHCHETGVFRGWLCHGCNVRLSGIEDSKFLVAAIEYLDQRRGGVMAIVKHGEGSLIPDEDVKKTASTESTEESQQRLAALREENEEVDG